MSEVDANGVRLYYEEKGGGTPILCMHGTGTSGAVWGDSLGALAQLGKVVAYDRRGHMRSELPDGYERASVVEQAEDAAALLDRLAGEPAVVVGRSYGGAIALALAARHPAQVRALVLLEPALSGLTPAVDEWIDEGEARVRDAVETSGIEGAGRALADYVLGEEAWEKLPEGLRKMFTDNGRAIRAELRRESIDFDPDSLREIQCPTLLVAADSSPQAFRDIAASIEAGLPDARTALVGGGHMITPDEPEIRSFIQEALGSANQP